MASSAKLMAAITAVMAMEPFLAMEIQVTMKITPPTKVSMAIVVRVMTMKPMVPGSRANEEPVYEPLGSVVTIGRARVRIVAVVAVGTNRRWSHIFRGDPHSDVDMNTCLG